MQGGPSRLLRGLVNGFVVVFRNTPPLVQIFFFYFGLGTLLPATETPRGMREPMLNNVQWAIISLSLFAGAFNVEIFRSGIEAVPKTTDRGRRSARLHAPQGLPAISSCRSPSASACRR